MVVYHLDKHGHLAAGMRLNVPFDDYFTTSLTRSECDAMFKTFPGGLSQFGYAVLAAKYSPAEIGLQVRELLLELVRRTCFPEKPSRLQSFFAAPSLRSISSYWFHALRAEDSSSCLYACEVSRVYIADEAELVRLRRIALDPRVQPRTFEWPDEEPVLDRAVFPPSGIETALQYWKSCEPLSDTYSDHTIRSMCADRGNPELLVQGDIHVLHEVRL